MALHTDYIRTISFHSELPWILTACDDHSVRIVDWQTRKDVVILTGHSHYVMCANWHANRNLIISASLDQTCRLWNFNNLCAKFGYHNSPETTGLQISPYVMNDSCVELYGILRGHTSGVNWACFDNHRSEICYTASDDNKIIVWRFGEHGVDPVESIYGHKHNVCCVIRCSNLPYLISASEDKTVKIWNTSNYDCEKSINFNENRVWIINRHPKLNIFGVGHDEGIYVIKLIKERVHFLNLNISHANANTPTAIKDAKLNESKVLISSFRDCVNFYNYNNNSTTKVELDYDVAKLGYYNNKIDAIFNQNKYYIIVSNSSIGTILIKVNSNNLKLEKSQWVSNVNYHYKFLDKDRLIGLHESDVRVLDLNGTLVKTYDIQFMLKNNGGKNSKLLDMVVINTKRLAIVAVNTIYILDILSKKLVKEVTYNGKFIKAETQENYFIIQTSKEITIYNYINFEIVDHVNDSNTIKSYYFDLKNNVIYYTTPINIKFYLIYYNTYGILTNIDSVVYIVNIIEYASLSKKQLYALDRLGELQIIDIDCTYIYFYKYILTGNTNQLNNLLKENTLLGKTVVSFLIKNNYQNKAISLINDHKLKFEVCIAKNNNELLYDKYVTAKSGDLNAIPTEFKPQTLITALECCHRRNVKSEWYDMYKKCKDETAFTDAIMCLKKSDQYHTLITEYMIMGRYSDISSFTDERNEEIRAKTTKSKHLSQDYLLSLIGGKTKERIQLLIDSKQYYLAYILAKNNDIHDYDDEFKKYVKHNDSKVNQYIDESGGRKAADLNQIYGKYNNKFENKLSQIRYNYFMECNDENIKIKNIKSSFGQSNNNMSKNKNVNNISNQNLSNGSSKPYNSNQDYVNLNIYFNRQKEISLNKPNDEIINNAKIKFMQNRIESSGISSLNDFYLKGSYSAHLTEAKDREFKAMHNELENIVKHDFILNIDSVILTLKSMKVEAQAFLFLIAKKDFNSITDTDKMFIYKISETLSAIEAFKQNMEDYYNLIYISCFNVHTEIKMKILDYVKSKLKQSIEQYESQVILFNLRVGLMHDIYSKKTKSLKSINDNLDYNKIDENKFKIYNIMKNIEENNTSSENYIYAYRTIYSHAKNTFIIESNEANKYNKNELDDEIE